MRATSNPLSNWTKCALCLLGALLTVVAIGGNSMLLIFPMWIFTYLWCSRQPRGPSAVAKAANSAVPAELAVESQAWTPSESISRVRPQRMWQNIPFAASFIGSGLFFGQMTEVFAIFNNQSLPPEKRILLSPDPVLDLFFGFFYYLLLVVTWYFLIRGFTYSKCEIFVITGIYGVFTEEVGQVLVRIFTVPVLGLLYAIIVSFVYGIFPMLAYMVSEGRLRTRKRATITVRFLIAAVALFAEWAFYGLIVLPALKRVVS